MGSGYGSGSALYEAYRRRQGQYGSPGLDEGADPAMYRPGADTSVSDAMHRYSDPVDVRAMDSQPDRPMGTIETLARALPQRSPMASVGAASVPVSAGAVPTPAQPRDFESYLSAPDPGTRPVLSTRRSLGPPTPVSVTASDGPFDDGTPPPGMRGLAPRAEAPGRAPRPPLRSVSNSYAQFEDERNALPSESQFVEEKRPRGVLGQIGAGLKYGIRTFVGSGFNPLYGATALVGGLVDKDANARELYRNHVEPRSVGRQRRLLSMANAELGMRNTEADNERADETLDMNRAQHASDLEVKRATLEDRERQWTERLGEKLLNDWMARNAGVPIPDSIAERSGHPELRGYVPPKKSGDGRPQFQYNQATGETAIVEPDGNGGWKITRPSGQQMEPSPEPFRNEPLSNFEAEVGPEAYGAKSWNDLIDNPEYGPAYQQALEAAAQVKQPGQSAEQMLNMLIAGGRVKLPSRQIPVYEYAQKNPHPLKRSAAATRKAGAGGARRLGPRSQTSTPKQRQAGEIVNYQGKRHRILSIKPDGGLVLDPTPLP